MSALWIQASWAQACFAAAHPITLLAVPCFPRRIAAAARGPCEQGDKSERALLWRLWARGIEPTAAIAPISRTGGEQ